MALDIPSGIDDAFKAWESNDMQRADAITLLKGLCKMQGDICFFNITQTAITDPAAKQWFEKNKPHLLPRKFERSLADRAFADGNMTARTKLLGEVGEQELTRIAQSYGLRTAHDTRRGKSPVAPDPNKKINGVDHASNPFHKSNWNLTKQSALVRSLGEDKARAIARSVGVELGSTRPNANF